MQNRILNKLTASALSLLMAITLTPFSVLATESTEISGPTENSIQISADSGEGTITVKEESEVKSILEIKPAQESLKIEPNGSITCDITVTNISGTEQTFYLDGQLMGNQSSDDDALSLTFNGNSTSAEKPIGIGESITETLTIKDLGGKEKVYTIFISGFTLTEDSADACDHCSIEAVVGSGKDSYFTLTLDDTIKNQNPEFYYLPMNEDSWLHDLQQAESSGTGNLYRFMINQISGLDGLDNYKLVIKYDSGLWVGDMPAADKVAEITTGDCSVFINTDIDDFVAKVTDISIANPEFGHSFHFSGVDRLTLSPGTYSLKMGGYLGDISNGDSYSENYFTTNMEITVTNGNYPINLSDYSKNYTFKIENSSAKMWYADMFYQEGNVWCHSGMTTLYTPDTQLLKCSIIPQFQDDLDAKIIIHSSNEMYVIADSKSLPSGESYALSIDEAKASETYPVLDRNDLREVSLTSNDLESYISLCVNFETDGYYNGYYPIELTGSSEGKAVYYLQPGEYPSTITVNKYPWVISFDDTIIADDACTINIDQKLGSEFQDITISWAKQFDISSSSFIDSYLTDSKTRITVQDFKSGGIFKTKNSSQTLTIPLAQGGSNANGYYFSITKELQPGEKTVEIDNSFSGRISTTTTDEDDTNEPNYFTGENISLQISDLKDKNGNVLSYFSASNWNDTDEKLFEGTVTYTNTAGEKPISLPITVHNSGNYDYITAPLPSTAGTYKIHLELYTVATESSQEPSQPPQNPPVIPGGNEAPAPTAPVTPSETPTVTPEAPTETPTAPTETPAPTPTAPPEETPTVTVVENPDGSKTETTVSTVKNENGSVIQKTEIVNKDTDGKITSSSITSTISDDPQNKGTSATVNVTKNEKGTTINATAKISSTLSSGTQTALISGSMVKQITDVAGTNNVKVSVKNKSNSNPYTVLVNTADLTAGKKLYIVLKNSDGASVLVNANTYTVTKDGDIFASIKGNKTYEFLNSSQMNKLNNKILETVKAKNTSKTVKKSKTVKMALKNTLNMDNVKSIKYTVSKKSVATVTKKGVIKGKKAGSATVKAKVTLKNGKTKTVKMKVKVKK